MTGIDAASALEIFRQLASERLRTLAADYDFKEAEAQVSYPEMWVLFRNDTTQVGVHFEYGTGVWVTVHHLTTYEDHVTGGEGYDLDYFLMARAPLLVRSHRLEHFNQEVIAQVLDELAAALREYADDALRGDFRIFGRLKELSDAEIAKAEADLDRL